MVLVEQRNIIVKQYRDLPPSISARVIGSAISISQLVIDNLVDNTISWYIDDRLDNIVIVQFSPNKFPQIKLRGEGPLGCNITTIFDYEIGHKSRRWSERLDTKRYFCIEGKTIPEIVMRIKYFDAHHLIIP